MDSVANDPERDEIEALLARLKPKTRAWVEGVLSLVDAAVRMGAASQEIERWATACLKRDSYLIQLSSAVERALDTRQALQGRGGFRGQSAIGGKARHAHESAPPRPLGCIESYGEPEGEWEGTMGFNDWQLRWVSLGFLPDVTLERRLRETRVGRRRAEREERRRVEEAVRRKRQDKIEAVWETRNLSLRQAERELHKRGIPVPRSTISRLRSRIQRGER